MHCLVKCCSVGAALGLMAFIVSACGNTSVTCEDLVTCPPNEPDAGGVVDSSVGDSADISVIKDAGAEDTSVGDVGSEVVVQVEASPEGGGGIDAEAAAEAAEASDASDAAEASVASPDGEAGIADATQEQEAEAAIPCDAGGDPMDGTCFVDSAYGVFVSPTGSDGNDGSKAAPFRTIGRGIALAGTKARVFVCGGSTTPYAEALTITAAQSGISLYGGFDCTSWVHSTALRAVVRPSMRGVALTVRNVTALTVYDFEFDSANAVMPGESSVAAFFASSSGVAFTRVTVVAGNGANGTSASAIVGIAASGAPGAVSTAACQQPMSVLPGTRTCGNETSLGGFGGTGAISVGQASPGGAGSSSPPVSSPAGQGGGGETILMDGGSTLCQSGAQGGAGADGTAGIGASAGGTIDVNGWHPNASTAGTDGHIGQGAGGGGGSRAPVACLGADAGIPSGASGGSGGSGGCGGLGGGTGMSGGSSIAILSYASVMSLTSCQLTTGMGGIGGNGAPGQQGGGGGTGGGGSAGVNGSHMSCAGGLGGVGGNGGTGGGGAGGSSLGIAQTASNSSVLITNTPIQLGSAGAGGRDGNGLITGPAAGAPGIAQGQLML